MGTQSLEAGEHQKPLKGGEEKQSAASGLYHCGGREREERIERVGRRKEWILHDVLYRRGHI